MYIRLLHNEVCLTDKFYKYKILFNKVCVTVRSKITGNKNTRNLNSKETYPVKTQDDLKPVQCPHMRIVFRLIDCTHRRPDNLVSSLNNRNVAIIV